MGGAAWRVLAIGAVVFCDFRFLESVGVVVPAVIVAMFQAAVLLDTGPVA